MSDFFRTLAARAHYLRLAGIYSLRGETLNGTVKSFSIVTGFSVATRLLSFLFKIWMSRSLGAEAVGLYQIALSVLLLLFSLTAGAPTVLSRKVAECAARGDIARQNSLTTASLLMGLGVSVVICAAFYACSRFLGGIFADERCIPIFLAMLPALIVSAIYAPLRSWFWGRKNFLSFSSAELLDEVLKIGFSLLFAGGIFASLSGAQGVALAFVLSDAVCTIVLAVMFFKAGGRIAAPKGAKELISATVPLSSIRILTSLSASLTALVIPKRLVAGGLSVALATAQYGRVAGMALPLIMAPVTVISALSVVMIPDIAALASQGDFARIRAKAQTSLLFAALVSSFFFAVYVPLGRELGAFFFGDAEAGKFVSYAAAIIFPLSLCQVTTPILNSLGMERVSFASYIAGLVCMLPCIFFLPEVIGIYSVGVASGLAFTVTAVINFAVLSKKLGKPEGFGKVAGVCAFSVPLALLGLFTGKLVSPCLGDTVTVLVLGVYVVFFYFVFVSAFGIVDIKAFFSAAVLPSSGAGIFTRRRPERKPTSEKCSARSRKGNATGPHGKKERR